MKILGIETSCDETAAAVVEDGRRILSNVVVSQIDIFAAYGGVIPEVAARSHLEAIMPVVDKALADAKTSWQEIDAIAVTYAPGLLGSLLIGTLTARTLAILHDKPLYAVHHLRSHVYANWLEIDQSTTQPAKEQRPNHPESTTTPAFPLIALVVSGGHTQILSMPAHDKFAIIGTTRDDAVGECFDKVAKILGLPYPGGPAIAQAASGKIRLAHPDNYSSDKGKINLAHPENYSSGDIINNQNRDKTKHKNESKNAQKNSEPTFISVKPGNADKYPLPIPKVDGLDFSFSGLKTAVLRAVQKAVGKPISFPSHELAPLLSPQQVADFAASFQKTAVKILLEKLETAVKERLETQSVVLAGGVAANQELRKAAEKTFAKYNLPVYFPALNLSGDNGAMVSAAAFFEIQAGAPETDPYKLNIYPRISIEN